MEKWVLCVDCKSVIKLERSMVEDDNYRCGKSISLVTGNPGYYSCDYMRKPISIHGPSCGPNGILFERKSEEDKINDFNREKAKGV